MGRGSSDKAVTAHELLYGVRRRGDGPVIRQETEDDFTALFDQLEAGSLNIRPHRLLPPVIDVRHRQTGDDLLGDYVHGEVNNVWNEPVGLFARSTKKENFLLIDYSSFDYDPDGDVPMPGTHREMAFLKSLAQTFPGDERVQFSFEYEGQLESFMSAYGPSPFKIINHLSYQDGPELSQKEMLAATADSGVLTDESADCLKRCSSLTEAWADPDAREALCELADHGELCLGRPLKEFAQIVI